MMWLEKEDDYEAFERALEDTQSRHRHSDRGLLPDTRHNGISSSGRGRKRSSPPSSSVPTRGDGSSLWRDGQKPLLSAWPCPLPEDWLRIVNQPQRQGESGGVAGTAIPAVVPSTLAFLGCPRIRPILDHGCRCRPSGSHRQVVNGRLLPGSGGEGDNKGRFSDTVTGSLVLRASAIQSPRPRARQLRTRNRELDDWQRWLVPPRDFKSCGRAP
jgi:hypothetical protein